MGALTVAEAYGPTLEQALDAVLAVVPHDARVERAARACPVCAGHAFRVELADAGVLAACRDCGSSVHAEPPPVPAAARARPSLRLVR